MGMNGVMATNGLPDERMQFCDDRWRPIQHHFWKVSRLFVVLLSCSCSLRQCVLRCCFAARNGVSRRVAAAVY